MRCVNVNNRSLRPSTSQLSVSATLETEPHKWLPLVPTLAQTHEQSAFSLVLVSLSSVVFLKCAQPLLNIEPFSFEDALFVNYILKAFIRNK